MVEAVGDQVTTFQPGDHVAWLGNLSTGGYSQYSLVGANYVVRVPERIDLVTAAALPVNYLTAYQMLVNLGGVQQGDTILVHAAAGGVGTAILQLARSRDVQIIATCSPAKANYVLSQGADAVVDYKAPDRVAQIWEMTHGKGVNLTLNPVSGASTKADLELLAPFGTAIIFGFLAGLPEGSFAEDLVPHFGKSIALRVSDLYTYYDHRPQQLKSDFAQLLQQLEQKQIEPKLHQVLPLSQTAEGHQAIERGQTMGKVVYQVDL